MPPRQELAARGDPSIAFAFQSFPLLLNDHRVPDAARASALSDMPHRDARLVMAELDDGSLPIGLTTPESIVLAVALGARHAVMLDGGTSAQLAGRDSAGRLSRWPGLPVTPDALRELGPSAAQLTHVWRGAVGGCSECRGTAYRERLGIYELLVMDDTLREELLNRRGAAGAARDRRDCGDADPPRRRSAAGGGGADDARGGAARHAWVRQASLRTGRQLLPQQTSTVTFWGNRHVARRIASFASRRMYIAWLPDEPGNSQGPKLLMSRISAAHRIRIVTPVVPVLLGPVWLRLPVNDHRMCVTNRSYPAGALPAPLTGV